MSKEEPCYMCGCTEDRTPVDKEFECEHCHADKRIRNPTGTCDHLYYPEYCETCNRREQKRELL